MHDGIKLITSYIFEVWLFLGVTLVVMPIALVYLTFLYRKYIGNKLIMNDANSKLQYINQNGFMALNNLTHNVMFMLSHLTNQGILFQLNN